MRWLVREAHRGGSPFWRQTAATDLFAAYLKKTPHSDTKTAPAQTTIDNENNTTPTSDNVSALAAPLPPKPPCNCMCPLEQRASAPSKPAWTPEVVDGRVASSPARTFGIVRVPTATDFAREDASELYRMTWGWEPRCSYEVDPDDENPFPLYGNFETGRRPMASVSSASGTMTALPAKIPSAARVCPVAVPGMSTMPTASAWVTPMPMTSSTISSCRVFSLVCL